MTKKGFVARGNAWIPRAAENGEDGIGIKNADVMFALHTSNTTPPTPDNMNTWRTSIKDFVGSLNGNNEKYVWTCTMITYTVGEPKFTGKYCLGKVSDFSDIAELYYVSDSKESSQFEGKDLSKLFGATYTAVKGKYLWTVVRYIWNPNVNGAPINSWYSTPICTGAFGADGQNGQNGQDGASAVTYEIQLDSDSVLFDTAKGDIVTKELGDMHFIKHVGEEVVDMTSEITPTSSYWSILFGYAKIDANGNIIYFQNEDGSNKLFFPQTSEKPIDGTKYAPVAQRQERKTSSICENLWAIDFRFIYAAKILWYNKPLTKQLTESELADVFNKGGELTDRCKQLGFKILATKTFTVNRNGYSVSSVDVIYAIGDSPTTAPSDDAENWKTTFNELKGLSSFDSTHYVWSANRIAMSDGTSSIKGKYCMGKCLDYADVTELYAMFGSNKLKDITLPTTNENLWKETYTAEKGKYLWTCNRYTNQNNATIGYSTPACQSYFAIDGKEGTSFVPCGSALAHYVSYAEFKTNFLDKGNTLEVGDNILLDKAENANKNYPCVCCLDSSNGYNYDDATDGDAYVIAKNLWVNSPQKNAWVNMGDISGNKGEDGKPGVSPTVYKIALQLNGTRIYINVVKTTGSTTTTKLINQYKSELVLNAYKDGAAFDDYHNEYFMEDGFVDLSAYQGIKMFTFVIKSLDGTNILDSANYSLAQDSFEFEINPDPVVFSTDENGNLTENQKTSRISCSRGGKDITSMCTFEVQESESLNCTPNAAYDSSYNPIHGGVSIQKIATETVGDVTTPATNGYAKVKVTDERSEIHYVYVKFQVNINKFVNKVYNDNKRWGAQLNSIESDTEKLNSQQTALVERQSQLEVKVENINLSVSEQRGGRFNMLMGSAFYKQGSGWTYYGNGVISCFGMDGCNALKLSASNGGNNGVEWSASSFQGNIKLEKGKAHSLAVFIKPTVGDCQLTMEVAYANSKTATSYNNNVETTTFAPESMVANSWNKAILQFTSSQSYDYCRVRIYITSSSYSEAYLSKPVLVDDDYKGWSFSKDDYDYVGGNMLSNTKQLTLGDNLTTVGGTVTPNFYGDSAVVSHTFEYKLLGTVASTDYLPPSCETNCGYAINGNADAYIYNGSDWVNKKGEGFTELLRWGFDGENIGANANKDYIFSFYAKGTGILQVFLYKSNANVLIEGSDGSVAVSTDGRYQIQLNNLWTRYWVHWIPSSSYSQFVLIRLVRTWKSDGNAVTSSSTWAWVSQPKLESGAHMTDYTERSADMVNKAALKKAGIEITSEQVKLYGEKVLVMNQIGNDSNGNPTYEPAAMFSKGKLNANLIDAKQIDASQLDADRINVSHIYARDTNKNVCGYFGYAVQGTSENSPYYTMWSGAASGTAAKFAVTSDGEMYSEAGVIGGLTIDSAGLSTNFVNGGLGDINELYHGLKLRGNEFASGYTIQNSHILVATGKAASDYDPFYKVNGTYEEGRFRDFDTPRENRYSTNNGKHVFMTAHQNTALTVRKVSPKNGGDSRVARTNAAMLVDSDCVGINSPSSNFFGSIGLGSTTVSNNIDNAIISDTASIKEALEDNRIGYVLCDCTKQCRFYLPPNPMDGQILMVLQIGSNIQFFANKNNGTFTVYGENKTSFWSNKSGQLNIFVYVGGKWRLNYMNG